MPPPLVGLTLCVAALHLGALWALHLQAPRATNRSVPPPVISRLLPVPAKVVPLPQTTTRAQPSPTPVRSTVAPRTGTLATPSAQSPAPAAMPNHVLPSNQAATEPAPVTTASAAGAATANGVSVATVAAGAATSGPTPPMAAATEAPSSHADYLNNPKPQYPPLSVRLREQGTVVVRTYIEVDGSAKTVELAQSSGFDRLDRAAMAAALGWRYVPGKKAGVPQAMWVNVPIPFILK